MIEQVIKRDGKTSEFFQTSKIRNAIKNAYESVQKEFDDDVFQCVLSKLEEHEDKMHVEEIQDCIEECLFLNDKEVYDSFHDYRLTHKMQRDEKNALVKAYTKKIMGLNIENQNANVDEHSHSGRKAEASDIYEKEFALNNLVSKQTKRNHIGNEGYIHDLSAYASGEHNCLSLPIDDLLANGAVIGQTDVRPAGGIGTAMQLLAVYFQIQSQEQFGGVSATHLDWTMVPYVRKSFLKHYIKSYLKDTPEYLTLDIVKMRFNIYFDEVGVERNEWEDWVEEHKSEFFEKTGLTEDDFCYDNKKKLDPKHFQSALDDTLTELYQAVEGMYHNLNTLQSRSGGQLPFTSINYGTCTLEEGRWVIEALLVGSIKGTGKHHLTPIFPCGIFQCMKGVNRKPGDPNYDLFRLALYSTSKFIYPNYVNVDWTNNKGYDKNDPRTYFSTMGCRTANLFDVNGLGQMKDGRGNICPTTIILPTLAMEALDDEDIANLRKGIISGDKEKKIDKFMRILSRKIEQAKDSLIDRFEWIASQGPESAPFMWKNHTMYGYVPEEGIRSALKHGTLAIGQLGLAECLQILIGCNHTTDEGMELAKRIERLYRKKCADYKEEYKLNFGVYFTPAENLCFTAMNKFKAKYGEIPNVSDRDYFTNSMHVPVWEKLTPFEKIDIESQLTGYSSAGCITYVEIDENVINNIDALEELVNYAMDKDIPYFAINRKITQCKNCGYNLPFEGDTCPKCGSHNVEQLGRVTGYLTTNVKRFNYGKLKEFGDRVLHSGQLYLF